MIMPASLALTVAISYRTAGRSPAGTTQVRKSLSLIPSIALGSSFLVIRWRMGLATSFLSLVQGQRGIRGFIGTERGTF